MNTITIDRAVVEQALEALEKIYRAPEREEYNRVWWPACEDAITALRAALAQQEEPEAVHQFRKQYCANWYDGHPDHTDGGGPYEERTLYTAPPQRKPLAEWQINDLMADIDPEHTSSWSFRQGVYAAEKHHGVKPSGPSGS